MHKAGFVNIIGNPNVGKSTLLNEMVGERLSIITSKSQTTRHRIIGIMNGENFQIVYSDTPGIIKPQYGLQSKMMDFVGAAFTDADIILYVTDVVESPEKNSEYIEKLKVASVPVMVIINKIDLSNPEKVNALIEKWQQLVPKATVIAVSALEKFNLVGIFDRVLELLPENPPFYPKDEFTDRSERFVASEIIREKILNNYDKEVPYSVQVEVESFKEEDTIIRISGLIYVMRDSQKGIIIGKGGSALKKTATEARLEMEKFFQKKVFLEVFVKVRENWRDNDAQLKRFGYQ